MITKQEYIEALCFEFKIIRHLGAKVKPETFEFRPTPKQRSVHELMTFMTYFFAAAVDGFMGDKDAFDRWMKATPEITLENFDSLMEKQEQHVRSVISAMTEEQLAEEIDFFGKRTRAMHLLNGPLKWATAYKMQLFMYLKMTGQEHLNTMNLWAGMDPIQTTTS